MVWCFEGLPGHEIVMKVNVGPGIPRVCFVNVMIQIVAVTEQTI